MELHRFCDKTGAGAGAINSDVRIGHRARLRSEAEQRCQLFVWMQRNQPAATIDPGTEHRRLGRRDRHIAQDHDLVTGQSCGRNPGDVSTQILVEPFSSEDLAGVPAERIRGAADLEDRAPGALVVGAGRLVRGEHHVDPVVQSLVGIAREGARTRIPEHAVRERCRLCGSVQRGVVERASQTPHVSGYTS